MTELTLNNYMNFVPIQEQSIIKALLRDIDRINKYVGFTNKY